MAAIGIILLLLIGAALLIGAGTLGYYLIYRHIINKRLAQDITHKKGLMSPFWMPVILITVMLFLGTPVLLAFLLLFNVQDTGSEVVTEDMYVNEFIDISGDAAFSMDYFSLEALAENYGTFSIEENDGYEKKQETLDGITYTFFSAEVLENEEQPAYLLYTEIGDSLPEDAVYLSQYTLLDGSTAIGSLENWRTDKSTEVCVISGIPMHENAFRYQLVVTCIAVKKSAADDVEEYMEFGEAIPEESILSMETAVFR